MLIALPAGAFVRHAVTDKESALKVGCPVCMVEAGSRCVEADGVTWRKALHLERHTLAISTGARVRFIGGARVLYADERTDDQAA